MYIHTRENNVYLGSVGWSTSFAFINKKYNIFKVNWYNLDLRHIFKIDTCYDINTCVVYKKKRRRRPPQP